MNTLKHEYDMHTSNKKIFDFYKNNPSLDFEQINLFCIDLFENVLQNANETMNKSISNQILTECLENKNKINDINNNLNLINLNLSKITNDIILKILDSKKDYIDEIKSIINHTSTTSSDKIRDLFDKNNSTLLNLISNNTTTLFDKNNFTITNLISNNITSFIDKNNDSFSNNLNLNLERNHNALMNELTHNHTDDLKNKISFIFEQSTSNMVKQISSFFENSNSHVIEKTHELINKIIPENDKTNKQLHDDINKFFLTLTEETKQNIVDNKSNEKMFQDFMTKYNESNDKTKTTSEKIDNLLSEVDLFINNNKKQQIDNFITQFDDKFNSLLQTIQQPILQIISFNDEKLNNNINKQQNTQEKMLSSLDDFLGKYKNNSSLKGQYSENLLHHVLVEMFDTGEIIDTSKNANSCDRLVKRPQKDNVCIENKNHNSNVPKDEVDRFISDCKNKKHHGIMLSQTTGIADKKNFQFDIIENNKILVYVHKVDYDKDKIKTAFDIIDYISFKLKIFEDKDKNEEEDDFSISKDIVNEMNVEFNKFISHRDTIINMIKDSQRKIIDEIKILNFPSLERFLLSKFNSEKIMITCDICNVFTCNGNNKKALASHKRGKECKNALLTSSSSMKL